jgi:arylsulfatase A-like enzyme
MFMIPFKNPRLVGFALFALAASHASAEKKRPNFLFILADDQAPHTLSTYGNKVCKTPALDRIAAGGMVFDGAYHMGSWSGAVCTPSRHMIMSGRTVWHLPGKRGKKGNATNGPGAPDNLPEMTMAAVFNRAGYDTMRTCKRGNSYEGANKQFTVRHDASKRKGTEEGGSAWHGDRVMDFLEERTKSKDEDPFLIYFGFSHPHDPRYGPEKLVKKYGADNTGPGPKPNPKAPKLQTNYLPAHPFHHGHPGLRDEEKVQGVKMKRDEATVRNELGREYACIENMDAQIGRVLDKLKAMGELENTYIIFTADHGIAVGRHGLMGKQNLYEHTWRVPYLVMGPGIKAGSRAQGNIYLLDTLATLCDFAGIDAPKTNEGTSFRPVLEGKRKEIRDVLYGVYSGGTKPGMRSVRKGDWKLIKYDVLDGKVRETQLFNLKENPEEFVQEHHDSKVVKMTGVTPKPNQTDLAEDPKYADKLKEMEALLLEQMKAHDDPYRLWNQKG